MSESPDWQRNNCYTVPGNTGIVVERGGQLGFAKLNGAEHEKLGSDLAVLVGVPVPRVEIGTVEGHGPFAISHIHSCRSYPLATKESLGQQGFLPAVKSALERASGLLSFLVWIGAEDHYDDTNLVVEERRVSRGCNRF
jgi:hypothetical protein